jgi:hypothetical protein
LAYARRTRRQPPGHHPSKARERIGWHPSLELARSYADRMGPGTLVDPEEGTYYIDARDERRMRWQTEWTNRDLYQGRKKRHPVVP